MAIIIMKKLDKKYSDHKISEILSENKKLKIKELLQKNLSSDIENKQKNITKLRKNGMLSLKIYLKRI